MSLVSTALTASHRQSTVAIAISYMITSNKSTSNKHINKQIQTPSHLFKPTKNHRLIGHFSMRCSPNTKGLSALVFRPSRGLSLTSGAGPSGQQAVLFGSFQQKGRLWRSSNNKVKDSERVGKKNKKWIQHHLIKV